MLRCLQWQASPFGLVSVIARVSNALQALSSHAATRINIGIFFLFFYFLFFCFSLLFLWVQGGTLADAARSGLQARASC
jgi:hypothetical protein